MLVATGILWTVHKHSSVLQGGGRGRAEKEFNINPLRPNNDVIQTSHCNIKGVSVREVMRIENIIIQVQFY